MTARKIDLRVDVSQAVASNHAVEIAVSIYVPDKSRLARLRQAVIFAFPGGTYGRAFYDLRVPSDPGTYSFARHLASRGLIVVTCDTLGTGESTPYEPFQTITGDTVIAANRAMVEAVLDRLAKAPLVAGMDPLHDPFVMALGHSLGAFLLIPHQAQHRIFQAVGFLGFTLFELPNGLAEELAAAFSHAKDRSWPVRSFWRSFFYGDGVPPEVIDADEAAGVRGYLFPGPIADEHRREVLRRQAAEIDVPVFLGFGSRDATADPYREATLFGACRDLTLFVLEEAGHSLTVSPNRLRFFERFAAWALALPTAVIQGDVHRQGVLESHRCRERGRTGEF